MQSVSKKSKDSKKEQEHFWHRFFWILLILCLIPLAIIALYNHASADDYAFSNYPHHGWMTSGLTGFAAGVLRQLHWSYTSWQGCYTAVLLGALDPVAFGDAWYGICAYLLIGFLILSNVIFCRAFFNRDGCQNLQDRKDGRGKGSVHYGNVMACILSIAMLQLVPRALDMFFWWDGAVNYLPFFGMLLILLAFLIKVLQGGRCRTYQMVLASILSFFAMGGNYVTALVNLLALLYMGGLLWYLSKGEKTSTGNADSVSSLRRIRICYGAILLSGLAGLAVSVLAPGNSLRMAQEGTTGITSIPQTVIHSIYLAYEGIKGNMSILLILLLALMLPFMWQYLNESGDAERIEKLFRIPTFLVIVLLFGLYAASYAPTVYVYGDGGPMRVEDVRFFYLIVILMLLEVFLAGKVHRLFEGAEEFEKVIDEGIKKGADKDAEKVIDKDIDNGRHKVMNAGTAWGDRYLCTVLLLLAGFVVFGYVLPRENREELTSICAARSLLIGEARQYDREMKDRYELLSDPATDGQNVTVQATTARPYLLFLYGLELTEDPEYWINETVATYYDKASVTLVAKEAEE